MQSPPRTTSPAGRRSSHPDRHNIRRCSCDTCRESAASRLTAGLKHDPRIKLERRRSSRLPPLEDDGAPPPTDRVLYEKLLAETKMAHPLSLLPPEEASGTPPPPWVVPPPTGGGDSWDRLRADPIFRANDDSILEMLRVRHRLNNHHPVAADGRVIFSAYKHVDGRRRVFKLRGQDYGLLNRCLEHHKYRDLWAENPIWEAWRTAPGDGIAEDPDMQHIQLTLDRQHHFFHKLRKELQEYGAAFQEFHELEKRRRRQRRRHMARPRLGRR